jgi:hypothetical protein
MKDHEKQIVYNQIKDGHRSIEELTCAELEELKTHWFDTHYRAMPPIDFDIEVRNELLRRKEADVIAKRAEASRIAKAYNAKRTAKFREDFF